VAIFLPDPDAQKGLLLYTESKVLITTDRHIGAGAKIR